MRHITKRKVSAMLLAGGYVLGIAGGHCVPEDFWITQWENTLTAAVDAFVNGTIVSTIDNGLTQE